MNNVSFSVSENGRKRVLIEKRKNVHAKVVAENFEIIKNHINIDNMIEIYYNPYISPTFINMETKKPIFNADQVFCLNGRKLYIFK